MTLCSGIGAPEIAAPWVDWRLASEIENFPRAVLQERFGYKTPEDHNQGDPLLWGDMTEVHPDLLQRRGIPLPEILVAGTPCQAFSIAGLRKGTEDARGNLTLKFVETCHAIVDARSDGKLAVLWENVPGVLSDKGNAFGCFLAGLVGADDALCTPDGESWPCEGMVEGPRARIAWRVLDAQYFGVAQRRRRVFVVVDFGNCIDPAAVLFERQGLQGNTPPSRSAGQGITSSLKASTGGVSGKDAPNVVTARMTAIGEYADDDRASTLKQRDYKDATDLVAHAFKPSHFTRGKDGAPSDITPPLSADADKGDQDTAVLAPKAVSFQDRFRGDDGRGYGRPPQSSEEVTGSLETVKPWNVAQPWAVRRLTTTECHRLQGFPDNHCHITYRNKPAADGPKYKALGNSMAVPCIKWIMDRMRSEMV